MLRTYFDASGKGESDISCVAGYIAHVDDWSKVESKWSEALGDYGLEYFHQRTVRKDLSADQWSDLEKRLTAIIQGSKLAAVGAALVNSHWRESDWGYIQTKRLDSPYEQCLDMALDAVFAFARDRFNDEMVEIFCCEDDKRPKIEKIYYRIRDKYDVASAVTIGASSRYMPLQCADFGAWRLRRSWLEIRRSESNDPWGSMPKGKGCGHRLSSWSLDPGYMIKRSMILRAEQASKE